jgi:hypothetical protein
MAKDPYADLYRFVAMAESGNRDYDTKGRVVTSPVGAKGRMQVMDTTNLDPGYGVRPAQNDTLEERARVGRDYLKAMVDNYGGDLQKGLAAYNAGPGNVDRALSRAQAAGNSDWMSYLPKPQETVPYVKKIVGNMTKEPGMLDSIVGGVIPTAQAAPAPSKLDSDPLFQMLSGSSAQEAGTSDKLAADPLWQMFNSPAAQVVTAPEAATVVQPAQETGGFAEGARNFGRGLVQGVGDMYAGIGQQSVNQGQRMLEELGLASPQAAAYAQRANQEVAQRESEYQAATPGSISAGAGRVLGTLAAPGGFQRAGLQALAAPMTRGAALGTQALPFAPAAGRVLGGAAGAAGQGAAFGSAAPVISGNYDEQQRMNAGLGGLIGGAAPVAGQALGQLGRSIGATARGIVSPFTQGGQNRIAGDILARAAQGAPVEGNAASIIPGSTPTLAEATGNPGIANLQRTMRDLNPSPFVAREEANAAARLGAFDNLRGTADDLAAARAARSSTADDYYGRAIANYDGAGVTPSVKGEITKLLKRPSIEKASKTAQKWAAERGDSGAPEGSLMGLHDVKTAVDDMIGKAVVAGKGGEAKALQATKDKLLNVMEKLSPDYATARTTYAEMSRPINQMEVLQGLNLTDQMGNITLQKVQTAINGIQKQMAKPGVSAPKSLESHQLGTLSAIRDDLLRSKSTEIGRSMGSNTAQNLAMQSMMSQAIPGRLGAMAASAPAGSLGTALGGGLGFMVGGPMGAAAGGAIGGSLGRTASSAINANNEAIQGALVKMLLNEGGSGLSALQNASRSARPITEMGALQRLLYPAISTGGAFGAARVNGGVALPAFP